MLNIEKVFNSKIIMYNYNKLRNKIISISISIVFLLTNVNTPFAFAIQSENKTVLRTPISKKTLRRMQAVLSSDFWVSSYGVKDIKDENDNPGVELALKKDIKSKVVSSRDIFNVNNKTVREYCGIRQIIVCLKEDISPELEEKIRSYCKHHFDAKKVLYVKTEKHGIDASLDICKKAKDWMADRNCVFLAIGDKDVMDITGLAARLYRRGSKYIYITTDSAQLEIAPLLNPSMLYKEDVKLSALYPPEVTIIESTNKIIKPQGDSVNVEELRDGIGNKVYEVTIPSDVRYSVVDSQNLLALGNTTIFNYTRKRPIFVCVDENVYKIYGEKIEKYFHHYWPGCRIISVLSGEDVKSMDTVLSICEDAKKAGAVKDTVFVAIGGGVTTDIVGVVATLYEGGADYIRIPTTLLGDIDAGIGVKTGVNFEGSKNFLGSFYAPIVCLNDPEFLKTLDTRMLSCGISEMIKIFMVTNREHFELMESFYRDILNKDFSNRPVELLTLFSIKDMLIELHKNLFEEGNQQRLPDFGHPIGHILESLSRYRIAHGEAVAIDMAITTCIAYKRGICSKEDFFRLITLLQNSGLPVYDVACEETHKIMHKLIEAKAHRGGLLNMTMPTGIGTTIFNQELSIKEFKEAVDFLKQVTEFTRYQMSDYDESGVEFKGAVIDSENHLIIQEREAPKCDSKEMVVTVLYAGLCGTDVKIIRGERKFKPGIVLGHECIARVIKVGANVKGFEKGDLITLNPNDPTNPNNIIGHDNDGIFSNLFLVKEDVIEKGQVVKIPPGLSNPLEAIFIEPVSCVVHTLSPLKKDLKGKTVAVVGAGQLGRLHALIAKAYGAKKVILINRSLPNLDFSRKSGVVPEEDCLLMDDHLTEKVLEKTGGNGADIVILTTTFSRDYLKESLGLLRNNGKVLVFGGSDTTDRVSFYGGELDYHDLRINNKTQSIEIAPGKFIEFIGRRSPTSEDFKEAIDLLASGKIRVSRLVSQVSSLDKLPEIVEGFKHGAGILGKIVVDMRMQGESSLIPEDWDGITTGGVEKKRVAIIGATGDLGSQLAKELLGKGYDVTVSARPESVEKLARVGSKKDAVKVMEGTVFSIDNLKQLIALNNTIFQMVGMVSLSIDKRDYGRALAVNGFSQGLITGLIKRANREGKVRLIYPSTQRVTLISDRKDVNDWTHKAVVEFDSIFDGLVNANNDVSEQVIGFAEKFIAENPIPEEVNIYELSKLVAERFIECLNNSIIARIANTIGEGYDISRTIPSSILTLIAGGTREEKNWVISPIYVDDVNRICIQLAALDEMHLGRYGICDIRTDTEMTTHEAIRSIDREIEITQGRVNIVGPSMESQKGADSRKALELLGNPFIPFDSDRLDRLIGCVARQSGAGAIRDNATLLSGMNPPYLIVFDIGGTTTRVGVSTPEGELIGEVLRFTTHSFKTFPGKTVEELQELLLDKVREYVNLLQTRYPELKLQDIAISFAGTVEDGGMIGMAYSLWGGSRGYPLQKKLEERIQGSRCYVTNDVVAASWRYGILEKYKDYEKICVLTISTGIGYKIFDVKHPDIDDHHVASLGHVKIDESPDAFMCDCGERGHLAAYASGRDAERRIRMKAVSDLAGFRSSYLYDMARKKLINMPLEKRKEILNDRVTVNILAKLTAETREHVTMLLSLDTISDGYESLYSAEDKDIARAIILENSELSEAMNKDDSFSLALLDDITLILARELMKIAESGVEKFVIMGGFAQSIKENFEKYLLGHMKRIGLYTKDNEYIKNLIDWAEGDDNDGLIGVTNMVRRDYAQKQKGLKEKIKATVRLSEAIEVKDAVIELLRENRKIHGLPSLTLEEESLLNRAFLVSYSAHTLLPDKPQLRYDGELFVYHVLDVARYLVEKLGVADVKLIAATFLHDVVEYTPFTAEQVEANFGKEILNIILDLSQDSKIQHMDFNQLKQRDFDVEKIAELLGIDDIESPGAMQRIAGIAMKIEHFDRLLNRPLDKRSRLLKVVDNIINYSSIDQLPLSRVKKREVAELEIFRYFSNSIEMPDVVKKDMNYYVDRLLEMPYLGDSAKAFVDGQEVEFKEKRKIIDASGLDSRQIAEIQRHFPGYGASTEACQPFFTPTGIVFGFPLGSEIVSKLGDMQDAVCKFFGENVSNPSKARIFYKNNLEKSHITLVSYGHYSTSKEGYHESMPPEEIERARDILGTFPGFAVFLKGMQIMPDGTIVAKAFVRSDKVFRMRKRFIQTFPKMRQFISPIVFVNLGRLIDTDVDKEKIREFNKKYEDIVIGIQRFDEAVAHNGQRLPLWNFNFRHYYNPVSTLEAKHTYFKRLADACRGQNLFKATLYCREPTGKVVTEEVFMPLDRAVDERRNLAEYIAVLISARGVLTGVSEVGLQVSHTGLISEDGLLKDAQEVLQRDFGNTYKTANFGESIRFTKGRLDNQDITEEPDFETGAIDYNKGEAIGIDIGATNLKIIFIRDGRHLLEETIPLSSIDGTIGDFIQRKIEEVNRQFDARLFQIPIYITIPGPVKPNGDILYITNLEKERPGTIDSLKTLRERFGNIRFKNDAKTAAFYQVVENKIDGNVILNTLGSGLGLGIIVDGKVILGPQEAHLKIYFDNDAVFHQGFEMKGDIESYASSYFVVRRTKELVEEFKVLLPEGDITPKMVADWFSRPEGDSFAKIAEQVYREYGQHLSVLYQEICRVTGIKKWIVIYVGGIATGHSVEKVIEGVREGLKKRSDINIDIKVGKDAPYSGALGSAYLSIMEQHINLNLEQRLLSKEVWANL